MNIQLASISLLLAAGCTVYNPPPEPTLQQPEGGAFAQGETAYIMFTEPISEDSLKIRLWPNERDIENEIAEGVEPVVESCSAGETCGDFAVKLTNGRTTAELTFAGELGKPGRPLVVDVLGGLSDDAGNATTTSRFFDMQFKAGDEANAAPIEFDDGIYIILAQVDEPIPAVLTLISHVRVLPDGRFVLAGAEGDEINGAPKNTHDPENLVVDETDAGWTAYAQGFIALTEDGKRLLESDPFDLILPVGPLRIHMDGVRLFAEIVKHPETGKDSFDGTLSFDQLRLVNGANESLQPGSATAFIADYIPEELIPTGHPVICESLCGAVVGLCEPPADFPHPDFCETE